MSLILRSQVEDLQVLIDRLQQNTDQVEKNILESKKLMAEDRENERNGSPLKHSSKLKGMMSQAEELLISLFMDVDKVKKQKHPQARMIEQDVNQLNDRWVEGCGILRDLYDKLKPVCATPGVDWSKLLSDKQTIIFGEVYGPHISDVEKQMAAHNILHRQIQEYNSVLSTDQNFPALQKQYEHLLESSQKRSQHLSSLYDFMQNCSKKMLYITEQEKNIMRRNWSDQMTDSTEVHMEYDRFIQNELEDHERDVKELQDKADALIEKKHPGSPAIESYAENLNEEWRRFLNLCLSQEKLLDIVKNYKKYQLDVETINESLMKILSTTKVRNMSNTEILLQLEDHEREVTLNLQKLPDLREFCNIISPLHLRRTAMIKPITVISQCNWSKEKDSVNRYEKYTLVSDPREEIWQVKSSTGEIKTVPGVCFNIPPPDSVAIDTVDRLIMDFSELKIHIQVRTKQLNIQVETDQVRKMFIPEQLLQTLDDLDSDSLKRFKWHLKQDGLISASRLENADTVDIVDKMIECFETKGALNITIEILRKIKQNSLAERLENS